jgi:CrcB protein
MLIVGLAVAGMVGAPARYLVDAFVSERTGGRLPVGTAVVNVSGSLVLGFVAGLAMYHGLPSTPETVLASGFCGSYTTFSTFAYETVRLVEARELPAAARTFAVALVAPSLAAALGLALASL